MVLAISELDAKTSPSGLLKYPLYGKAAVVVVARKGKSVRLVVVPGEMRPNAAHSSPDPQSDDPQLCVPQAAHVFLKVLRSVQSQPMLEVFVMVVEVAVVFAGRQSSADVRESSLHLVGSRILVKPSLGQRRW